MTGIKEVKEPQTELEANQRETPEIPEVESPSFSLARAGVMAAAIFGGWQIVYHLAFMGGMPIHGMFVSHLTNFLTATAGAVLLTAYFIRVLALQNERLKAIDRQKNMLTSAIVRDLRQPLTGMRLSLSYMKEDGRLSEAKLTGAMERMVDIALDSSTALIEMINDMLDVTRLEDGQPILRLRPVSSPDFIAEGIRILKPLTETSGKKITIFLPPQTPVFMGDAARLRRVVTNLAGNAVKHAGEGGTVTVTARHDSIRARLLVSVADTGPGVPPELRHRFFDKYFRVGNERRQARTSAGLGLHFCKLVVEAHGGEIYIENGQPKGAVFTFSIPVGTTGTAGLS